jgi:hypothetical protein
MKKRGGNRFAPAGDSSFSLLRSSFPSSGTVATAGFPGSGFYEEARKPGGRIHSWFPGFLI